MLQVKRPENRSAFIVTMITFVVALLALTMMSGSVFSNSRAKTFEPQPTQDSKPIDLRELTLGVPIERELAGGDAHSYRVTLTEGQYLNVVVKQKGIDVVVRVVGPDGRKLTEVDNHPAVGEEIVFVVAEASGDHRLEVASSNKEAKTALYEIKIEELRQATAKDHVSVTAERVFEEGNQLRDQQTAGSRRKAIQKYGEALSLWHSLGDREKEAFTFNEIGFNHSLLGEAQEALESYGQALTLLRLVGNRVTEAVTLNNIGSVYNKLGESQKALEYFRQSLPLKRALEDRQGESTTLGNMAVAYSQMGELQESLEHHFQALSLTRAIGGRRVEAVHLGNIGVVYSHLGEREKALEYYQQALALRRALGDRIGEAVTLYNIGVEHFSLGELLQALDYFSQSLSIRRELGDRLGESYSLSGFGQVYIKLGKWEKALEYNNQALALARATGDRRSEAKTLNQIGVVYRSLGEPQTALDYFNQGLQISRTLGDRPGEATTLYQLARTERDRGFLSEARPQIEAALNIIESIRGKVAYQNLRTSYLASQQEYYEFYVDLLMRMHQEQPTAGYDAVSLQASERARARSLLEILTEARADIRQGVDAVLLERERSSQQQLNAKSERLTRLLSGKHTEEQETAARKEVEGVLTDYQDVEARIRAESPRYAALTQPQPLSLKEIQQLLDDHTLLLEYALGEDRSYLWAVTPTSITSFELPKRADIEAAATKAYEALTALNKLVHFEKQEKKLARVAQADAKYFADSAVLSQMLLGPVAGRLGRKRLLIVGDGALQYVPFGALPVPGGQLLGSDNNPNRQTSNYRPLIAEHEILSLPSASTLAVLRREVVGRWRGAKTVAVLADPVFQDDDPRIRRDSARTDKQASELSSRSAETQGLESEMERSARDTGEMEFRRLPFSRQEAKGIAALTSNAMRKESLDFEANRVTATSADLSNYRIIHFATHALLDSQHPELSGIVLSLVNKDGKPQDGFLRLNEIYNLKLGADLVVLSACRTALGKEIKGEGLVGLTRGFMYAGAPRVVASLWAVDDEITAELMKRFYREMLIKGQRPAAALQAAQVAIWKERRLPPYYWAAFVLQGEWK